MISHPYRSDSSFQAPLIPSDVFYFTNVKIVKVALFAISALSALAAISTLTGHLMIPTTLYCHPAIPLLALAILCVRLARGIKDYKDPRILQKMQIEARDLSYLQIAQIHGVENMILYKLLPQKIEKEAFCVFFETLSVASLALKEADKDQLKEFKSMVNGTKRVQSLLGSRYEEVINSYERRFKAWVLDRS